MVRRAVTGWTESVEHGAVSAPGNTLVGPGEHGDGD